MMVGIINKKKANGHIKRNKCSFIDLRIKG